MDIIDRIKEVVGHIQSARNAAGFNQTEVAKQLGKKQPSISNWEKGDHLPNLKDIIIMCDLFGVTPNKLFGVHEDGDGGTTPPATPRVIGPCIASSSGKVFKITPEEENYVMACLLEARDGQRNAAVLDSVGKKGTSA